MVAAAQSLLQNGISVQPERELQLLNRQVVQVNHFLASISRAWLTFSSLSIT